MNTKWLRLQFVFLTLEIFFIVMAMRDVFVLLSYILAFFSFGAIIGCFFMHVLDGIKKR